MSYELANSLLEVVSNFWFENKCFLELSFEICLWNFVLCENVSTLLIGVPNFYTWKLSLIMCILVLFYV